MESSFCIAKMTEAVFEKIVADCGGQRAYPDQDSMGRPGVDFIQGNNLIELKCLDEERFFKEGCQTKLAGLFGQIQPGSPVVVIDPEMLEENEFISYLRAVEGPIKNVIEKASDQIQCSKDDLGQNMAGVLIIFNNSYTGIRHAELKKIALYRAAKEKENIDAIVLAGIYVMTDGFEFLANTYFDIHRLNAGRTVNLKPLKSAWEKYVHITMRPSNISGKPNVYSIPPIDDIKFDIEGVTYIRPTLPMPEKSEFFVSGRPRKNPPNNIKDYFSMNPYPVMNHREWRLVSKDIRSDKDEFNTYAAYEAALYSLVESHSFSSVFIPVVMKHQDWKRWLRETKREPTAASLRGYARDWAGHYFNIGMEEAKIYNPDEKIVGTYINVVTEIIGKDFNNDLSLIELVNPSENLYSVIKKDIRMPRQIAMAWAVAYGLRNGFMKVRWREGTRYAWT